MIYSYRVSLPCDGKDNHPTSSSGGCTPSGYGGMGYVVQAAWLPVFMRQQGSIHLASANHKDLVVLKELVEAGKLVPAIDRTCPLNETPDAFRYLEEEHARGKVVITLV